MTNINLQPARSLTSYAQTLEGQAVAARNAAAGTSTSGSGLLGTYARWAEVAFDQLTNVMPLEDADRLVHTQNYWLLRSMSGGEARIRPQVDRELYSRATAFDALSSLARQLEAHWTLENTVAVLDTNTLVQAGKYFDEIDWAQQLGDLSAHLVVPLAVVRELDSLKRKSGETRTRARGTLKRLRQYLGQPGVRGPLGAENEYLKQITLEVLNYPDVRTTAGTTDDQVIECAAWLSSLGTCRVVLVSWDGNMAFLAAGEGVQVRSLSADLERV